MVCGLVIILLYRCAWEDIMQMAITFMAVVAGLIFSVAVALLAEEFIFGQVFRMFFSQQAAALKTGQKR
jgi:Flp pilus assembly protein protease CpaA